MKHVQGKDYYVSAKSEENALECKVAKEFACYTKNGNTFFHSESGTDLILWKFSVEIPEPEIDPWTEETFPLDEPVWVRHKKGGTMSLITTYTNDRVFFKDGWFLYKTILDEYDRVMPNRTIVPCGVVK